ncbi:DUF5682 domain-containing protein [Tumidithrix helvetica PCC 7403]|uniref:DUF5682 family protein n=1 Tax=Tumidithrix helvetica TaxID=3457545 RepID=UPI003CC392DD
MKNFAPNPQELDLFLRSLTECAKNNLIFFPIRHHSPACAWHIQQLILTEKPAVILIEGPADMTELIPFMLHERAKAPFAVYTTYIDTAKRLGDMPEGDSLSSDAQRFAGYYPFCDYSPELVALRVGASVNAKLEFIDLTFAQQAIASHKHPNLDRATQTRALLEESYFRRSAYLTALAKKTGCRDVDDLWDHLFEANFKATSTSNFIQNVAAYCFMARLDSPEPILESDGTLARERAMASAIQSIIQPTQQKMQPAQKILVITGGFHTVALPFLQESIQPLPKLVLKPEEGQTVLMRYSFEQLDALNGYGAGMPAPEFYQRFWQELQKGTSNPLLETANQILVEIGNKTRAQTTGTALSTADAIAALEQARRLAAFRHHQAPTREDLLDGIRSCFVKGAMDGEGTILMSLVRQMLTGDRIGDLPPDVGVPPIVNDFREIARHLRFKIDTSLPQSLTLDIYRKVAHRQASRFLHALHFLEIPFARIVAGPDFVQGRQLDRLQEVWEYRWIPQTESSLIERSLYGTTLETAAVYLLQQAIAQLEEMGKSRSALEAVRILLSACRMGLHAHTDRLLDLIATNIAEDPAFMSLVDAVSQLVLLWQSREPLEAHDLIQIPALSAIAYQRLCYLLPDLSNCSEEEVMSILGRFGTVQELFQSDSATFDPDLFYDGLHHLLATPQSHPTVAGGAAGILYRAGLLSESEIVTLGMGYLQSSIGSSSPSGTSGQITGGAGFLRGLLYTCREVAWNVSRLLEAIDAQLQVWDDDEFLHVLPEFRLAFADLTPRETDKVAAIVAAFYREEGDLKTELGDLTNRHFTEADLQFGLRLEQLLTESLQHDRLIL